MRVRGIMPREASLLVIVDQTAKIHRLYRVDARWLEGNKAKSDPLGLEPFDQFLVEMGVIGKAQAAGCGLKTPIGAKRVNA